MLWWQVAVASFALFNADNSKMVGYFLSSKDPGEDSLMFAPMLYFFWKAGIEQPLLNICMHLAHLLYV